MSGYAVWRVFYRPKPDGTWNKDGDYAHDDAVNRVMEIRRNGRLDDRDCEAFCAVRVVGVRGRPFAAPTGEGTL